MAQVGYYSSPYNKDTLLRLQLMDKQERRQEKQQMIQSATSMVGTAANAYLRKRELDAAEKRDKLGNYKADVMISEAERGKQLLAGLPSDRGYDNGGTSGPTIDPAVERQRAFDAIMSDPVQAMQVSTYLSMNGQNMETLRATMVKGSLDGGGATGKPVTVVQKVEQLPTIVQVSPPGAVGKGSTVDKSSDDPLKMLDAVKITTSEPAPKLDVSVPALEVYSPEDRAKWNAVQYYRETVGGVPPGADVVLDVGTARKLFDSSPEYSQYLGKRSRFVTNQEF